MPKTHNGLFVTHIDLPAGKREAVIALLNARLADTSDLASQVKQAHWNVKGPEFMQLHLLFDDLYDRLLAHNDLLAERATALGGKAMGTARMAAANSQLPELPEDCVLGLDLVRALVERYGQLATSVRAAIDESGKQADQGTADLFTEISRALDKDLWFLEAHLQAV
jgi:starvation-inducible DNA-binding protein